MQRRKDSGLLRQAGSLLNNLLRPVLKLPQRLGLSRPSLTTIACLVLCLLVLLMLCGCQPKLVKPTLPQQADPRELPQFHGKTYRDALQHIPELREAFMACESDKSAIRRMWADE